jgi:CzcA family heavy metal efflux pump
MGQFFDALIRWSIRERVVVLLAALALLVGGVYVSSRATLDVLPDFTPPHVVVQTEAPGMATTDVELYVTRPLERALLGTPQTTSVRSFSMPGLSVVTMQFEEGLDVYRARQFTTERLQLARATIPKVVHDPQLAPVSAPIGALLKFCITGGTGATALRDVRTFADWTLRPRILAVPGVAQVIVHGGDVERVEVRADPVRMRERGVRIADLYSAVASSQAIEGAGFIDREGARLDVVNDARLTLAGVEGELGQAELASARGTTPSRIEDVAEVARADEPRVGAAIYDATPAVYVQIMKLSWASSLDVTRDVEHAISELRPSLPTGATIQPPVYRQGTFIRTSIWSVGRSMVVGGVLVVLILVAFLRRGRLAFISLTAIPASLVAATSVLVLAGASINGMTLGGLAIAVGEVVDDAIVDVENVWRRLRENAKLARPRPALDVVRDASVEVRSAVVYATLLVTLVLVPVLFLGGIAGRIFSPLAQAYILAIFASLIVAVTITPALCAWLLPKLASHEEHLPRVSRWMLERYARLLRRIVDHPRLVLGGAAAAVLGAAVVAPMLGGRFLPEFYEDTVIAHVNAVPGTSLDETARVAGRIDQRLRASGLGLHIASRVGRAELGEDAFPVYRVELDMLANPNEKRGWEELTRDVGARIGEIPGTTFSAEGFLGERVHEILSGQTSPLVVNVMGPDLERLRELAREVTEIAETTPGLGSVRPEPQLDVPQLSIRPRRDALGRYHVSAQGLIDSVVTWRQGRSASQVLGQDGRIVDVVIAGPPSQRTTEALRDLPIDTGIGEAVPLSVLADIDIVPAPAVVFHDGGTRRIAIGADSNGGSLSNAAETLRRRLDGITLPQGYRIEITGEVKARHEAAIRLLVLGAMILAGILLLLAVAFHSLRDATIVMLNLPLGLVGGVASAMLDEEGLSVAGLVGFVTLFGIISRNGIMLVAHKRTLDERYPDEDPVTRVFRAAEERLLPILMTAAAAGLGLLPLALFGGRGSELESPMAVIVCGGLVSATFLNLLVLPTLYVWLLRRKRRKAAS